jgi:hypothetical protein
MNTLPDPEPDPDPKLPAVDQTVDQETGNRTGS